MANKKALGAAGIAAALAIAAPFAVPLKERWEGRSLDPYQDIVGVWTVCYGETRVEMRRYTPAECTAMLDRAYREDFGPAVLRCAPALADKPRALAASVSLAYNIGTSAFCRSTAARRFNAGDIRGGCEAMKRWNMAGGRVIRGLVNRRADEARLCLLDARA